MTYKDGEINYNGNFLINPGCAVQFGVWACHSTRSDLFFALGYVLEKIHVIKQKWVRHEGIKSSFFKGV